MSSLHLNLRSLKQWRIFFVLAVGLHAPMSCLQAQSWYNTAWTNRKPITVDHTKVSGSSSLTNFPVLVSLPTDSNLAAVAQSSGNDILFTASDGVTKLNHQIELYTASTGRLIAWVQIPTLSTTADTVIYIYYGNASASNQQNVSGVWDSNYKGVYHFPDGTTLTANDSTGNSNNGSVTGTITATAGQIDGALSSVTSGNNDVTVNDSASLRIAVKLTISAWVNPSSRAQSRKFNRPKTKREFTWRRI